MEDSQSGESPSWGSALMAVDGLEGGDELRSGHGGAAACKRRLRAHRPSGMLVAVSPPPATVLRERASAAAARDGAVDQ
jgi:hypothetical protein